MSSGFVSGGSLENPTQRDDAWLKAQQELEESRRKKAEETQQQNGKSLYEVLQENKAKKQEAFEESIKLKNQFRSLDDDEVDFLDSVLESERAKEAAIRKETSERLSQFRKQQEEAEKAGYVDGDTTEALNQEQEAWTVTGKKRKKGRDGNTFKGLKVRRTSSSLAGQSEKDKDITSTSSGKVIGDREISKEEPKPKTSGASKLSSPQTETTASTIGDQGTKAASTKESGPKVLLGLGGYSSDDD